MVKHPIRILKEQLRSEESVLGVLRDNETSKVVLGIYIENINQLKEGIEKMEADVVSVDFVSCLTGLKEDKIKSIYKEYKLNK